MTSPPANQTARSLASRLLRFREVGFPGFPGFHLPSASPGWAPVSAPGDPLGPELRRMQVWVPKGMRVERLRPFQTERSPLGQLAAASGPPGTGPASLSASTGPGGTVQPPGERGGLEARALIPGDTGARASREKRDQAEPLPGQTRRQPLLRRPGEALPNLLGAAVKGRTPAHQPPLLCSQGLRGQRSPLPAQGPVAQGPSLTRRCCISLGGRGPLPFASR